MRKHLATLCFFCLSLTGVPPALSATGENVVESEPYQLGQGLYWPQYGLRIGGYASIHYYDVQNRPETLSINGLSLFLTQNLGTRWKLFSELEIEDALTVTADRADSRDADFDVERLYADYFARQDITLRFGKFLTPVGQWNLIHADPLVWSVTRPLTTSAAFSEHAAGAMMYGVVPAGGNDLDYWLFVDHSERLDPAEENQRAFEGSEGATDLRQNNFRKAVGGRLLYHALDDRVTLGASYLDFELDEPQRRFRLAGLDFTWSSRHVDLSGEAIYRTSGDGTPDERGGFLQAVVPLPRNVYVVGRFERYETSMSAETTTLDLVGFNYRPKPTVAFKLEYRTGSNNAALAPDGWLGSFAVLF